LQSGLIVGVDIGGTKTHIRWQVAGNAREQIVQTRDWRRGSNVASAATLIDLVHQGASGILPDAIGIGAHGCDTAEECFAFEAELQPLTTASIEVVNDAELMVPAAGLARGIGVVVGTGSIAVARLADHKMMVAGGWGWILGDEGSAAGLVREAAKAVRNGIDLGQPTDELYDILRGSLGASDFSYFGRSLEQLRDATEWGRHSEAVFKAADAGSQMALDVIKAGAEALALLVQRLIDRGVDASDVVAGGGVVVAQPLLYRLFQEALAAKLPALRLTLLREPPVVGAIAIASRLAAAASPSPVIQDGGLA
jgi:N-acetylglucosamine kinase-like BadF-type ATPase